MKNCIKSLQREVGIYSLPIVCHHSLGTARASYSSFFEKENERANKYRKTGCKIQYLIRIKRQKTPEEAQTSLRSSVQKPPNGDLLSTDSNFVPGVKFSELPSVIQR